MCFPLRRSVMISMIAMLPVGCASTQINYNTLDIASTYDQLVTKQVTYNIRKTLESTWGLPAFVKVTAATATTQNSVSPTATIPVSTGITNQIQTAATGLISGTTKSTARAAPGLSVAGVDQWSQTYTLSPVSDPDQLRRLRVLYQFVTRQITAEDVESVYPLIETGPSTGGAGGTQETQTTLTVNVDKKPVDVTMKTGGQKKSESKTIYLRRTVVYNRDKNSFSTGWIQAFPDTTFIKPPGCVLCDYQTNIPPAEIQSLCKSSDDLKRLLCSDKKPEGDEKSPGQGELLKARYLVKNIALRNDWLYRPDEDLPTDAVALPTNGGEGLYVKGAVGDDPHFGLHYFYEFVLLTEDASSQGTGSPTSGGQSEGRKTPNLERVSIPVAAGTTPSP